MTPLDLIIRYRLTALWCAWTAYAVTVTHGMAFAR